MLNDNICRFSEVISGDLICTDFVYEKTDVQSAKTFTDKYILGFISEGSGVLNQGDTECSLSFGYAFFVPKNSYFSIRGEAGLSYFYISFYGRRADELTERFGLLKSAAAYSLGEYYEKINATLYDCLEKATDRKTDIFSECAVLYLLAHLDVKKKEPDTLISGILSLTNRSFTDSAFSLGALADALGYDAKYLSSIFKKSQGICYSDYLRDLRIKRSVFLMEQGITSVKNAALLSGFSDALYYSKIFKKKIGKTPKEYIAYLSEQREN